MITTWFQEVDVVVFGSFGVKVRVTLAHATMRGVSTPVILDWCLLTSEGRHHKIAKRLVRDIARDDMEMDKLMDSLYKEISP